jgi:hypothetical protein
MLDAALELRINLTLSLVGGRMEWEILLTEGVEEFLDAL